MQIKRTMHVVFAWCFLLGCTVLSGCNKPSSDPAQAGTPQSNAPQPAPSQPKSPDDLGPRPPGSRE
jgi:hypothetical protein